MGKYDFRDIDNLIEMTENQLSEEVERYRANTNKSSTLLAIFGMLFLFIPQICLFVTGTSLVGVPWYIWLLLAAYTFTALVALFYFVRFIWPVELPHKCTPRTFSEDAMKAYMEEKELSPEQASEGVRYSYLNHVEECLRDFKKINSKKGMCYFKMLCLAIFSFLFYVCVVPYVIINEKEKPVKIIIMSRDESEEKKFDPKDIIVVKPERVREGLKNVADSCDLGESMKEEEPIVIKEKRIQNPKGKKQ